MPPAEVEPTTELDVNFSDPAATAVPWSRGLELLESAEVFWLSTVRPEGRPHVTPLLAVWADGALNFCTGPEERKAKNLAERSDCVLTTGNNDLREGFDVVIEGVAEQVSDHTALQVVADLYEAKYGTDWVFEVRDGAFFGSGGRALVFRVAPVTAFGFDKDPYSQTKWTFS